MKQSPHADLVILFTRSIGGSILILGLVLMIRAYLKWLNTSDTFRTDQIAIEGNELLTEARILEMGKLSLNTEIWKFDLVSAERKIESLGFVDDVKIKRILPDRIHVKIVEKKPIALLKYGNKLYCLDREGLVLPTEPGKMYDMPILSGNFTGDIQIGQTLGGAWVPKSLLILQRIRVDQPHLYSEISEMILGGKEGILIYTCRYGIPVYAGDDLSWPKIRVFDAILRELIKEKKLQQTRYIDLRFRGQVLVGRSV